MFGLCHICQRITQIAFCPRCDHWMCAGCRHSPWERIKAALRSSYPGCCYPLSEAA